MQCCQVPAHIHQLAERSVGRPNSQLQNVLDPVQMVSWLLILLPLMVAGVIASLKVGELAGMLVSGSGGGGAGMTGALMTAATGGKALLAGKAAGAAGGK